MEVEDGYPNYLVEKGTFFTRPEGIPLLMDFKKTDGNSRLLVSEMKVRYFFFEKKQKNIDMN